MVLRWTLITLLTIAQLHPLAIGRDMVSAIITVAPGVVDVAADGQCSLVEAIVNANTDSDTTSGECVAGSGVDVIELAPAAHYTLTTVYADNTGLPAITSIIAIAGNDAIIERDPTAPGFRLLYVDSSGDLTLNALTLHHGAAGADNGGAIYAVGEVTLNNALLSDNSATNGGGIFYANGGLTLQLSATQLIDNQAASAGGGLYALGAVALTGGALISNTAGVGGGLRAAQTTITTTRFIGNQANSGGAILITNSSQNSFIRNALFARNSASGTGAALVVTNHSGVVEVIHATIYSPTQATSSALEFDTGTIVIRNSIIGQHAIGLSNSSATVTEDYNLFFGNAQDTNGTITSGGHSLTADPQLTDVANDDYHLLLTSPAIDAGVTGLVNDDFEGDPRPIGASADIGVDEAVVDSTLTVELAGDGSGSVTSAPAGIDCGLTCTASFAYNTVITLTALPVTDTVFSSWSGACSGLSDCVLTLTSDQMVTATFSANAPVSVTVALAGNGTGNVTSAPAGINCQPTCAASFPYNTFITLTANAEIGSVFTGWEGACSGIAECLLTLTTTQNVTATFTAQAPIDLSAALAGDGSVTSAPAGISCAPTCTAQFPYNSVITLTATPDPGSTFMGWSGACSGFGQCFLTLTTTQSVTATFAVDVPSVTLFLQGTGGGTITSQPAGVQCGLTCTTTFPYGTVITLTATPFSSSVFSGWQGACGGTNDCVLSMTQDRIVSANFDLITHTLSVTRAGNGLGQVLSNGGAIFCGSFCTATYDYGTVVTLTATPFSGSVFGGWSGACAGTGLCVVTITAETLITATFANNTQQLFVAMNALGNSGGFVTSQPAGINCGLTCTTTFPYSTVITLTATSTAGFFTSWDGACSGAGLCIVTLTDTRAVTATFALNTLFLPLILR